MSSLLRFLPVTVLVACGLGMNFPESGDSLAQGQQQWVTPIPTGGATEAERVTISGVVFHDLDGNGLRDAGEPGLSGRYVRLIAGEWTLGRTNAGRDGRYAIDVSPLVPGDYVLSVELEWGAGACAMYGASFLPLPGMYCVNVTLPWNATTPDSVEVTLTEDVTVDFGAQPAAVAVVAGDALLEVERAPVGTSVEAFVNGMECGTTTVTDDPELNFEIHVLGAGERAGCATEGDTVRFLVGGVAAAATLPWVPFSNRTPRPGFQRPNLVAIEQHAWYWFERFGDDRPADGAAVQALVDGAVCGETTMVSRPRSNVSGFSRLLVPSEAIEPGCGRPGATVSFVVDGVETDNTVPWVPGLQRTDLGMPEPEAMATPTQPLVLPGSGLGAASGPGNTASTPGLVWALVGTGMLALGVGLGARKTRQ